MYVRVRILVGFWCLAIALLVGCGGSSASSSSPTSPAPTPAPSPVPTPLPAIALVSDNQSGTLLIVDTQKDTIVGTVNTSSPAKMVSAGGVTVIQNNTAPSMALFNNASRTITATVTLGAIPVDVAISPDGKTAWAAESNGTIEKVDTATAAVVKTVTAAGVQRLVMSTQGTWLLGFVDNANALIAHGFYLISTDSPVTIGVASAPTFLDETFNAGFSDDTDAYLLSCGAECGGTSAGVSGFVLLPPLSGGPYISPPIPVAGATVGVENAWILYVAGTPPSAPGAPTLNAGTLQVVNQRAQTAGPAFSIADGRHLDMALSGNGKLFIGSRGCTSGPVTAQNRVQGCLTIFDTVTLTITPVLVPASRASNLDITSLLPIPGRNVMYVCQGGVLDIYDSTTNAVSTLISPISVPGKAFGLVLLKP